MTFLMQSSRCKIPFFSAPQTDYRGENGWSREQVESQLRAELEESQEQLQCAHNIQQEQKSKMQSLRYTNQRCYPLPTVSGGSYCQTIQPRTFFFGLNKFCSSPDWLLMGVMKL